MLIRKMKGSDLMPLYRLLSDEKVMEHIEPVFDLAKTEARSSLQRSNGDR